MPRHLAKKKKDANRRSSRNGSRNKGGLALSSASAELLFVVLPFIVIGIALAHEGLFRTIVFIPEWSIVSAVIVGQAIVRFASVGIGRANIKRENSVLVLAALLVCLLAPILTVLAIVLTSPNISGLLRHEYSHLLVCVHN
jgi:hypothetical protein